MLGFLDCECVKVVVVLVFISVQETFSLTSLDLEILSCTN